METPWRPLRHFVLKVHSRCDLACDHCYIYEHADQSWRGRPLAMEPETARAAAGRIAQHAARHGLASVGVVLHGGEPLLLGPRRLRALLTELRGTITRVCELDLRMQTNAVRLDAATCELLLEFGVKIGVSLDGGRAENDRHRRYRNGASSHDRVRAALRRLREPRYRPLYAGLLCTVDAANDPIAVYEALLAEQPPRIDLLLPHATWDTPPPEPLGEWLTAFHDRWAADDRPVPVRLFDSIRSLGLGGPTQTEAVGVDAGDVVVIETDGAWEEPDSMKTTGPGGGATGLTVFDASADDVAGLPAMRRRRGGLAALSATCRSCALVRQCGGGLTAHRWARASGFDNPSVYCDDLKELIITINEHPGPVAGDLGAIPADAFDGLGYGYGDAAAIALLAEAELAVNRALVSEVAGETAAGSRLLAELERQAPAVFDEVLRHPFVRSWAVSCLDGGRDCDPDWAAAIAAAVAVRAGLGVEVPVRAHGGRIHLPTVGFFAAPAAEVTVLAAPGSFTLRWPGGRATIVDGGEARGWHAARWVTVDGVRILLEDADPYRDRLEHAATGHLDAAAAGGWSAALAGAWEVLGRDAPDQLDGLRAGLRAIVPLTPATDGTRRSATSRHAFGALGIAPTDAEELAVLLVHEFQHTKLGAVLDLIDLVPDDAVGDRLRVGWRPDPRPVEAALQGAYAHLAVADVWRRRAERTGDEQSRKLFRMYRDWTAEAIDALRTGDRLTPAGARFVRRMADTVGGWAA
ncbi:FxsB family cyclophane-forming radical SAM/SPASM peptide maturase [Paractinoplanes lichenicola]|uniref:FxsB family radical SAM/SPASM domain protein n=1 Tax=Paractinoplanes lichenicola TaxID=2802976 RepID=A0ABS1VTV3_9ACTN|nr:FxsB family cyclophane-forming radical SAM/SPASM peptide maturase [Actinoplanes lichenicola]MBL7257896.1 FxsB family radical SAM/SPASM domain protein [Actinoplanes lichenicola]